MLWDKAFNWLAMVPQHLKARLYGPRLPVATTASSMADRSPAARLSKQLKFTRTPVDAWHQCIVPGPFILICSNIKIMKYNYFFIEIGIYRSRFDTQYIYPAKIFFYLANIIIDQAFKVWALVQETTGSIPRVCPVLPGSTG